MATPKIVIGANVCFPVLGPQIPATQRHSIGPGLGILPFGCNVDFVGIACEIGHERDSVVIRPRLCAVHPGCSASKNILKTKSAFFRQSISGCSCFNFYGLENESLWRKSDSVDADWRPHASPCFGTRARDGYQVAYKAQRYCACHTPDRSSISLSSSSEVSAVISDCSKQHVDSRAGRFR